MPQDDEIALLIDDDESSISAPTTEQNRNQVSYKYPFQKYFDLSTEQFLHKLKGSVSVHQCRFYLSSYIQGNPDFYGPFWITITCAFVMLISRIMSPDYKSSSETHVELAMRFLMVISCYSFLTPVIIWGFLYFMKNSTIMSLPEWITYFGYSLTPYVICSIPLCSDVNTIRWISLMITMSLSGSVVIAPLMFERTPHGIAALFLIVVATIMFPISLKALFFSQT